MDVKDKMMKRKKESIKRKEGRYDIRKEGKLTESNYEQGIRPYVPA